MSLLFSSLLITFLVVLFLSLYFWWSSSNLFLSQLSYRGFFLSLSLLLFHLTCICIGCSFLSLSLSLPMLRSRLLWSFSSIFRRVYVYINLVSSSSNMNFIVLLVGFLFKLVIFLSYLLCPFFILLDKWLFAFSAWWSDPHSPPLFISYNVCLIMMESIIDFKFLISSIILYCFLTESSYCVCHLFSYPFFLLSNLEVPCYT